ncbi:hypothetical protein VPG91_25715 [Nitrospirillum amazonense]|uniref:hypothetical protein n=1 Tax=Nitrospirillum amazonense TaxID=28077 RepID=UPI002DD434E8|nr:hypothetical protein [Nitrospirillum amazonense]MEC4594420.1 hypothetical protein [Nitrospirillum amazonense]
MGPWGALIMGFFGAIFFSLTAVVTGGLSPIILMIPLLAFCVIAAVALQLIRRHPAGRFDPPPRIDRIISRCTTGEALGIPAVILLLTNTGHRDLILPGIATVVGLHFLPMAYAIPSRPFGFLGCTLIAAAVIGALMPQPAGSILAGLTAALALWIAAAFALRRARALVAT